MPEHRNPNYNQPKYKLVLKILQSPLVIVSTWLGLLILTFTNCLLIEVNGHSIDMLAMVGQWFGGIASAAAVVVALELSWRGTKQQAFLAARENIANLTRISFWVSPRTDVHIETGRLELNINNETGTPITFWELSLTDRSAQGSEKVGRIAHRGALPLSPGVTTIPLHLGRPVSLPVATLQFVDRRGDCWERSSVGDLHAVDKINLDQEVWKSVRSAESRQIFTEPHHEG